MSAMALGLMALFSAVVAQAHPLGNTTINRQAEIRVLPDRIQIRYLMDMAEIPTLLAAQQADWDSDGEVSRTEWERFAGRYTDGVRDGIRLTLNGRETTLVQGKTRWSLVPGAAGLTTLRLETEIASSLSRSGKIILEYRDSRRPEESGWKEVIVAAAGGASIQASNVPQATSSQDLSVYPRKGGEISNILSARSEIDLAGSSDDSAGQGDAPSMPVSGNFLDDSAVVMQGWALYRLGAVHIATGWDHLVFLLGLLLAHASKRRLIWVVTAFTAAHSLTLALAASGWVKLPDNWVEPGIALTIAYVGLANLLKFNHGVPLAFAFGLVHGFGFAGALSQTLAVSANGSGEWLWGLAAFNLGIESFQLLLILACLPLLDKIALWSRSEAACNVASVAVAVAGLGWFLIRV